MKVQSESSWHMKQSSHQQCKSEVSILTIPRTYAGIQKASESTTPKQKQQSKQASKQKWEAGERAQQLVYALLLQRTLVLEPMLGLTASCNSSSRRSGSLFYSTWMSVLIHARTHTDTHTDRIKTINLKKKRRKDKQVVPQPFTEMDYGRWISKANLIREKQQDRRLGMFL